MKNFTHPHSLLGQSRPPGFSLVEVVIALGILGVTAPVMTGLIGSIQQTSERITDQQEVSRARDTVALFLAGKWPDATSGNRVSFAQWIPWAAGQKRLVYVFRTAAASPQQAVSLTPPTGPIDGKLFVAELVPPATAGVNLLGPEVPNYLPLSVAFYRTSPGAKVPVDPANRVAAYPMVCSQ
jgi:prepilin-type N-terminal cleavage/methylation domain-containing protein